MRSISATVKPKAKQMQPPSNIDVFIATDRKSLLPALVLSYSIRRHASLPVRACPLMASDRLAGSGGEWLDGAAALLFTLASAKRFRGAAQLLAANALACADIAPLLQVDFGSALLLVPEATPSDAVLPGAKHGSPTTPIVSVCCEQDAWQSRDAAAATNAVPMEWCAHTLPAEWARGDPRDPMAPLVHYADPLRYPWLSAEHETGVGWFLELRLMLDAGALAWHQLNEEVEAGWLRPSLVNEVRHMPHLNGFDPALARQYMELDERAGFRKPG